ncbi:MAG TPA: four helix bundle protein [Flavobacteriales bacterium]|nr:four helix bundle protein [Flavobacteriales bacterium]
MEKERTYDLEDRTTAFGSAIINFVDRLPHTLAGRHMGGQLIRSGTAPALHYGESQSAESPKDFIHKVKLALKELKESRANLRMIKGSGLMSQGDEGMTWLLNECEELIRILAKSVATAKKSQEGQDSSHKSQVQRLK